MGTTAPQHRLPDLIASADASLRRLTGQRHALTDALTARQPTRADAFAMSIGARRCTERSDAKQWLLRQLDQCRDQTRGELRSGETIELDQFARLGGLALTARAHQPLTDPSPRLSVYVHGIPDTEVTLTATGWTSTGHGIITRLENKLGELDSLLNNTQTGIANAQAEIERGTAQLDKPFPRAAELSAARTPANHRTRHGRPHHAHRTQPDAHHNQTPTINHPHSTRPTSPVR